MIVFQHLTTKTDAKLREALAIKKTQNKTVIIVAQRINTVLKCRPNNCARRRKNCRKRNS